MPTTRCMLLTAALAACGPKDEVTTEGSTTGDAPTTADAPTTSNAPTTDATTGGDLVDQFGFVCLELYAGESVEGDPFAGTARIVAKLYYEPCLIDYYMNKHPEMRADGPADAGGTVFKAWTERLCASQGAQVPCTVESIEQTLSAGDNLYSLSVTYAIPDAGAIAGLPLLWGPAPLPAHAECDDGLQPFVKLVSLANVIGLDATNAPMWTLQSFGPTQRGLPGTDVAACLQLAVDRP